MEEGIDNLPPHGKKQNRSPYNSLSERVLQVKPARGLTCSSAAI
jgi:hypothetical protein